MPAAGFALGIERLVELSRANLAKDDVRHLYFIVGNEKMLGRAMEINEKLRDEFPALRSIVHCGGGSFKSQFKRADKSGAAIAFIIGDEEFKNSTVSAKFLREDKPQQALAIEKLNDFIKDQFF